MHRLKAKTYINRDRETLIFFNKIFFGSFRKLVKFWQLQIREGISSQIIAPEYNIDWRQTVCFRRGGAYAFRLPHRATMHQVIQAEAIWYILAKIRVYKTANL